MVTCFAQWFQRFMGYYVDLAWRSEKAGKSNYYRGMQRVNINSLMTEVPILWKPVH